MIHNLGLGHPTFENFKFWHKINTFLDSGSLNNCNFTALYELVVPVTCLRSKNNAVFGNALYLLLKSYHGKISGE